MRMVLFTRVLFLPEVMVGEHDIHFSNTFDSTSKAINESWFKHAKAACMQVTFEAQEFVVACCLILLSA